MALSDSGRGCGIGSIIGGRLATARRARGLSQVEFARQLGVSQSQLSNIERGRSVNPATMLAMCVALGLDAPQMATEVLAGAASEVELAINDDPTLRPEDGALLVEIYRVLQARGPFPPQR